MLVIAINAIKKKKKKNLSYITYYNYDKKEYYIIKYPKSLKNSKN